MIVKQVIQKILRL